MDRGDILDLIHIGSFYRAKAPKVMAPLSLLHILSIAKLHLYPRGPQETLYLGGGKSFAGQVQTL